MQAYSVQAKDPRNYMNFVTDEIGAEAVLRRAAARHPEAGFEKQPIQDIWLDVGGPISVHETKLFFEAAGLRFGVFAVLVPIVKGVLEELPESDKFPGCVGLPGRPNCIFSLATRAAVVEGLAILEEKYRNDIAGAGRNIQGAFPGHPHAPPVVPCPCGSGKPTLQCCAPWQ
jgi:hypothetical protein